ncbi:Pycsar system effector family protein [Streptomyces sp. NPDC093109]|uniref:Pycsar system effector family protein n=1 Tax=Streptomyces sp. NPDC093109 TaxID=3154977 RepID=UPI00344C79A9
MNTTGARLDAALDITLAEIGRSDTKAGNLLGALGLPLAVLVAVVPGRDLPAAAAVLAGTGTIGLIAAMLIVLLVVRPDITGRPRGSYLYWADCTPAEVVEDLTHDHRAEHLVQLAILARAKYRALRWAIHVTAAALLALVAATFLTLT